MLAGQSIPLFGDGSTQRDYTWVADIVEGVLAACDAPLRWEIVNLGGAHTSSLADLVRLLEEALGVQAIVDRKPAQPGDMPLTSADVSKARQVLAWAPRVPLRDGVSTFARWIRSEGRDWT
jgi:UDP-glucuronate 4-epimerase